MVYRTEFTVRGYHADFYGHVNNARYLEFFEEDRWALLEARIDLQKWKSEGLVFLVVNINVNYRKAVPVGTRVAVTTELAELGKRSATLLQKVVLAESGEVAADAMVVFVIVDASGKAVVLEGEVAAEIAKLENLENLP
jgi:thioesterase-3